FLPDGKAVLSAGTDFTIRVWEYPSGKELRRITSPVDETRSGPSGLNNQYFPVALSSDGKTVAACFKSNEVCIVDVATGKELQTLTLAAPFVARERFVRNVTFSPDGQQLAVLDQTGFPSKMRISIWDWAKAKELRAFAAGRQKNDTLVWSPDGTA